MQLTDKGVDNGQVIGAERLEQCFCGSWKVGGRKLWSEVNELQFEDSGFTPAGEDGFSLGVTNGDRRLSEYYREFRVTESTDANQGVL